LTLSLALATEILLTELD